MKKIIIVVMSVLVLGILIGSSTLYFMNRNKIAVLGYHNVFKYDNEYNGDDLFILNLDKFEEQLKFLKDNNYKTLTLEEFSCYKKGTCKQPEKSVLITFDDGFYFNYKYAFPLLQEYNMNATVFIVGVYALAGVPDDNDVKSLMSIDMITSIKDKFPNITVASHSYDLHGEKTIDTLTVEEIRNDFEQMKTIVDSKYFAYPFGIYNDNAYQVLEKYGFELAFGFGKDDNNEKKHRKANMTDENYLIPRFNIYATLPMWKFKLYLLLP